MGNSNGSSRGGHSRFWCWPAAASLTGTSSPQRGAHRGGATPPPQRDKFIYDSDSRGAARRRGGGSEERRRPMRIPASRGALPSEGDSAAVGGARRSQSAEAEYWAKQVRRAENVPGSLATRLPATARLTSIIRQQEELQGQLRVQENRAAARERHITRSSALVGHAGPPPHAHLLQPPTTTATPRSSVWEGAARLPPHLRAASAPATSSVSPPPGRRSASPTSAMGTTRRSPLVGGAARSPGWDGSPGGRAAMHLQIDVGGMDGLGVDGGGDVSGMYVDDVEGTMRSALPGATTRRGNPLDVSMAGATPRTRAAARSRLRGSG